MKKKILLGLMAAWSLSMQAGEDIERLKGCWTDTTNTQWTYGFFDHFAIYQNDFWNYDQISLRRKKGRVTLRKGRQTATLHIRFLPGKDSLCLIGPDPGNAYAHAVRRCDVPPVPQETSPATAPPAAYAADSAVVQGYVPSQKATEQISISVASPFHESEQTIHAHTDSTGRFSATVPVTGMTETYITCQAGGLVVPAILAPKDTLTLYAAPGGQVFLMGKSAAFNRERLEGFRQINAVWSADRTQPDSLSPDEWKSHCLQRMRLQRQALEAYARSTPKPSRRTLDYFDQHITMQCADQMLQRRFALDKKQFERLPPAFLHTVDSLLELARPPYTGHEALHRALRAYCHYHSTPFPASMTLPAVTLADYLQRNRLHTFSSRELSDLKLLEEGTSMAISLLYLKTDSNTGKARMAPYQEAIKRSEQLLEGEEFKRLMDTYQDQIAPWAIRRGIEKELAPLHRLHLPDELKAFYATTVLTRELDRRRMPYPPEILSFAREQLHNPELYALVAARQRHYQRLQGLALNHPQSLKSTDSLEDIKEPAKLWEEILKPHKGKIIYADFWGTWCSPCKWQMEAVPAVKEALADEADIVFLYLAVHSPEESWLNFLKETDLTGPQSIHYNLPPEMGEMLTRHLSVSAYPTYLLIGRDGRIIDRHPPTPRAGERLVDYLRRMIHPDTPTE